MPNSVIIAGRMRPDICSSCGWGMLEFKPQTFRCQNPTCPAQGKKQKA